MIVKQVDVNICIPATEVRIVAMQPFIQLHYPTQEPFQWSVDVVTEQLNAISRTLDLARDGFGGMAANFTLFPEYSIPGFAGAMVIDQRITDVSWVNETVIIAGVHGMDKAEYTRLCRELNVNVSPSNAPDSVPDNQWVNCCIIWIKDQNGKVNRWVQLKIRPSWPEMNVTCHDMFCGSTVYLFKARYKENDFPCNFFSLICFDWVAGIDSGTTVRDEVLRQLNEEWLGVPTPLHWVFVIQHNPAPNHSSFLNSTYRFLTNPNTYPFVERKEAVVLHTNTAVSARPSRRGTGAFTACIFSPSAQLDCSGCRPTVCMQPSNLRAEDILLRCKDVVFREMGECIHLFKVRVPQFVVPDPTDRTLPVIDAEVHSTTTESDDPRLCGSAVPAVLKWVNDSLDNVSSLAANDLTGCPLNTVAESVHPTVISQMRSLDGKNAVERINWATCSTSRDEKIQRNPDVWGLLETEALEHVVHSLTSLGIIYKLDIINSSLHCTLNSDTVCIQIVAIRGEKHEDCRRHYDTTIPKVGTDPVLVIARDRSNLKPTKRDYSKFYEADNENGIRFLDYQSLVTCCREAEDKESLRRCLDAFIPTDRRII